MQSRFLKDASYRKRCCYQDRFWAIRRGIPGRLVGPNGLAERTQREIWTEIATLYASNGRNLPLVDAQSGASRPTTRRP